MATTTADALFDTLRRKRLLEPSQLADLTRAMKGKNPDPDKIARALLKHGWLTTYQANQLLQGRADGLVLGQYVILDRIGEGGMGQVYKAKHRGLGRIVAVKVIRKDRLDNADAVGRFQREIRAASKLSHPNVVLAYDADQIGDTHLMVMEYVEGTDLSCLVKERGALPVAKACECIRQAALGLQHAHEKGMVHRDIKPANLLVAKGGQVKVLDLGLSRFQRAVSETMDATLTRTGSVMGTPDYMAPEQARDSHTVDIRADIYSLGCSLYHLLAGQVPFTGGTGMEKVFKHQLEEPDPIEALRPEVPRDLAKVLRKMMAKQPEDRYATPAAVAEALAPFAARKSTDFTSQASAANRAPGPDGETVPLPGHWPQGAGSATAHAAARRSARHRKRRPLVLAALLLFLGTGATLLALLLTGSPSSEVGQRPGDTRPLDLPRTTDRPIPTVLDPQPTGPVLGTSSPFDALTARQLPEEERPYLGFPKAGLVAVAGPQAWRHWGGVTSLVVGQDDKGSWVASGGDDHVVRIWEAGSGKELRRFTRHGGTIRALAMQPGGKSSVLASAASDGTVAVWDVRSGTEILTLNQTQRELLSLAFTPDGTQLAVGTGRSAQNDAPGSVLLYKLKEGKLMAHSHMEGEITALAYSSDGKTLATIGRIDPTRWQLKLAATDGTGAGRTWNWGNTAAVLLAASPADASFATVRMPANLDTPGNDRTVLTLDVGTRSTREVPLGPGAFRSFGFSPDGKTVALGHTGAPRLIDVKAGTAIKPMPVTLSHAPALDCMAFTPDGRTILSGSQAEPVLLRWDVSQGLQASPLDRRGPARQIAFGPEGLIVYRLSSGHLPSSVRAWYPCHRNKDLLWCPPALPPPCDRLEILDGNTLLLAGTREIEIREFNKVAGTMLWRAALTTLRDLVVSPDSTRAAALGQDDQIHLFDLKKATTLAPPIQKARPLSCLAYSLDGKFLIASAAKGVDLSWWNLEAKDPNVGARGVVNVALGGKGVITHLVPCADDSVAMLAQLPGNGGKPSFVVLSLNLKTIRWRTLFETDLPVGFLRGSLDGKTLAVGGKGFFRAIDVLRANPLKLTDGSATVLDAAFSPDSKMVASTSSDGMVRVWNLTTAAPLPPFQLGGPALAVAFAPDNRYLATANANGTAYLLRLPLSRVNDRPAHDPDKVPITPSLPGSTGRTRITPEIEEPFPLRPR